METFAITQNTVRTLIKVSGVPIVLEQEYDITLQSDITIENPSGFPANPIDSFKYRITKDGVQSSNEGTVKVIFETMNSVNDLPDNIKTNSMLIGESILLTDFILRTGYYDRIKITEINGKGSWTYNGLTLYPGTVIFNYNMDKIKFIADDQGSVETDYANIKFLFGDITHYYTALGQLTIGTTSKAQFKLEMPDLIPDIVVDVATFIYDAKIDKGIDLGTCKITVDTSTFNEFGMLVPENKLTLTINGVDTVYNTQGTFTLLKDLDSSGSLNILCKVDIKLPLDTLRIITITLNEVNSNSANVDLTQNIINLDIPITTI
jgi:hypothetical protein